MQFQKHLVISGPNLVVRPWSSFVYVLGRVSSVQFCSSAFECVSHALVALLLKYVRIFLLNRSAFVDAIRSAHFRSARVSNVVLPIVGRSKRSNG